MNQSCLNHLWKTPKTIIIVKDHLPQHLIQLDTMIEMYFIDVDLKK